MPLQTGHGEEVPSSAEETRLDAELSANDLDVIERIFTGLGFDQAWYISENPDLDVFRHARRDLIHHFLRYGWRENRRLRFFPETGPPLETIDFSRTAGLTQGARQALQVALAQSSKRHGPVTLVARSRKLPDETSVRVNIEHQGPPRIGDTLTVLPWILRLSELLHTRIYIRGLFSDLVKPLLMGNRLRFDRPPAPGPVLEFTADIERAFHTAGRIGLHMAQAYFLLSDIPMPPTPMTLPLYSEYSGVAPGFVIHPFTASDGGHTKEWWPERWVQVMSYLRDLGPESPIYIVGGNDDDVSPYMTLRNTHAFVGRPLPQVLDLLRSATVFVSLDSGLSHLAHFGGVHRHILICGDVVPPTVAVNCRGRMIRGVPASITSDDVISMIKDILPHGAV